MSSPDHQFAAKLIDSGMMATLLAAGTRFSYEVAGSLLLTYCPRLEPSELPALLDAAAAFAARIPQVILDQYPAHDVPQA